MTDAGGHDVVREIARGLSQTVAQALADGAQARSLEAARDLAQLLSLPGLDRLLGALAPHAGSSWPAPLRPGIERVRRAAAESARDGNVESFRRMDDELSLTAQAIERGLSPAASAARAAAASTTPSLAAESAPIALAGVLEGASMPRGNQEVMRTVHVHPRVGGALRAALDWLLGDGPGRLRTTLESDGGAVEVTCEGVIHAGIYPASEVLANVGGHLGPTGSRPGAWTIRVPIVAERETYLLLEQGELRLAIPWHAVVRVRLMPTEAVNAMAQRQGLPVLARLAAVARRPAEQPVVVVALGLKRACLVADRLVWRMAAEPAEPLGIPPSVGIVRAVHSDNQDLYWVLDPEWLLRGVAAPAVADARTRVPGPPSRVAPAVKIPAAPPAPIPFPSAATRAEASPAMSEPLRSLEPRDVQPLEVAPAEVDSRAPAVPADPTASTAPVPTTARRSREVLVAEDSITARIFLVRLLEQSGFVVHAVGTAAELRVLLSHGPWALVCADIELPDARGEAFLREAMHGAAAAGAPLLALVRDADDEREAQAAGVPATLRKPYEREPLMRVLSQLMVERPGTSGHPGNTPDPGEWGAR